MSAFESLSTRLQLSLSASTDGTQGTLFSTPLQGGAQDADSSPLVIGENLALVNDKSAVCLGKIGSGKVCLKLKCRVKSHKKTKMSFAAERVVLGLANSKDVGHCSPVLDASSLDASLVNDLLQREVGTAWTQEFALIAENAVKDEDGEDRMKKLTATAKKAALVRTPARVAKRETMDKHLDSAVKTVEGLYAFFEESGSMAKEVAKVSSADSPSEQFKLLLKLQELLCQKLDVSGDSIVVLGRVIIAVAQAQDENFVSVEDLITGLRGLVSLIQGDIGIRAKDFPPDVGSTIWSVLQEVLSWNDEMEKSLTIISDYIVDMRENLIPGIQASGRVSPQLRGARRVNASGILPPTAPRDNRSAQWSGGMGGFSAMGSGYGAYGTGAGGGGGGSRGGGGGGSTGRPTNGDEEEEDDDDSLLGGQGGFSVGGGAPSEAVKEHHLWENLEERVSRLERHSAGLSGTEQTVFFGNHVFRSKLDVAALLERHLGTGRYQCGLFCSPQQILNAIHAEFSNCLPAAKDYKALNDLRVNTRDYLAATAVLRSKPTLFDAKRLDGHYYKSSSNLQCRFKTIPTYEDWGLRSDMDSLYYKFSRALDNFDLALQSAISSELAAFDDLQLLATKMLASSSKFVRSLFEYMTECFEHLNPSFPSATDTWELVCFSVEEVFLNEFAPARSALVERDFNSPQKLALDVIWVNLRGMRVVEEFLQAGIKNHPSMNGAQIRFVIKQAGANNTIRLEQQVKALKEDNRFLQEQLKEQEEKFSKIASAIESKLRSVESRADQAAKAAGVLDKPGKKKG